MFHTSTQRAHWIFKSADELQAIRAKNHEAAVMEISRLHTEENLSVPDFLTLDECQMIIRRYTSSISGFCRKFNPNLPSRVRAAAVIYMQRYYLHNTVFCHPPSKIMLMCVFFACKAEEQHIKLDQFCRIGGVDESTSDFIRKHELHFMSSLQFHIVVHAPERPLRGLVADATATLAPVQFPPSSVQDAATRLVEWASTDVGLLYPPSRIALAALREGGDAMRSPFQQYIKSLCTRAVSGQANSPPSEIELNTMLDAIVAEVARSPRVSDEMHEQLKAKLLKCRNPLYNPDSELFKRQECQQAEAREAKRRKTAEEFRRKEEKIQASILGAAVDHDNTKDL